MWAIQAASHQLICYSHVAHHQSYQAPGFLWCYLWSCGQPRVQTDPFLLIGSFQMASITYNKKDSGLCLFLSLKKHFQRPFSEASPGLDAEGTREGLDSAVLKAQPGEALNR